MATLRQPKIINDPNAAPAAMRADDVDLQAQEGDFIMGYPAMQQSGTRVRSLVEQAMLKAKNAGVKTKGYKSGDKVDILVHNKEMHIPRELIPYVEGGYTTLKKLNAPSKYDVGDVVSDTEGFVPKPNQTGMTGDINTVMEGATNGYSWLDKYNKIVSENKLKDSFQPTEVPRQGTFDFQYGNPKSKHPLAKNGNYGSQVWKRFEHKVKKNLQSYFKFDNPMQLDNANSLYKRILNNVKSAIENTSNTEEFSNPHFSTESILHPNFVKSSVKGSFLDYILSNQEEQLTNNKVKRKVQIVNNRLDINYPDGMSAVSNTPFHPNKKQTLNLNNDEDLFLDYNESDSVSNFKNVMQERINTGNDANESVIGTYGWDAFNTTDKNKKFPNKYNKLLNFLIDHEGFTSGINSDAKGTYTQGHGIQLSPSQVKAGVDDIDATTAKKQLGKEILRREDIARNVYNFYTKDKDSPTFDKLDANRQMMLIEMAFNMGSYTKKGKGLAEFKNFINGVSLDDYTIMENEYHRIVPEGFSGLEDRNKDFFEIFIAPYVGKYSTRILKSK